MRGPMATVCLVLGLPQQVRGLFAVPFIVCPAHEPWDATLGELWVPYLEKAVAVHSGGWDKIDGGHRECCVLCALSPALI